MRAILKPKHFTDTSSYTKPVLRTGFRGLSGGQIALPCQEKINRTGKQGGATHSRHAGQYRPLAVKPFRPASWRWYAKVEDSEDFTAGVLDDARRI